ncbi:ABC transporter permease [Streptomyces sp. NPDC092369]|uniref:ABC transporter permease n=1 Tax=Streptomyces sp. NPDC092369 TaxID=3366015 RepID=UPI00380582F4
MRSRGVVIMWLFLVLFFWAWAGSVFFSLENARLVANAAATTALFGGAVAVCLLAGHLDLSVPGTATLGGMTAALLIRDGTPVALALAAAVLIGALTGVVNAGLVEAGLNPLAVTVGMLAVLAGIASIISDSQSVPLGTPSQLAWLGLDRYGSIPAPVLVVVAVFVIYWFVLSKTYIGARLYAVGGNPDGARRAGLRAPMYRLLGFVLSGMLSAVGGVTVVATINQANPTPDTGQLFQAMTAVALAGISFGGGRGQFLRVAVGALIIATVSSGLIIRGVAPAWATFATGALLIAGLAFDKGTARLVTTLTSASEAAKSRRLRRKEVG